MAEPNRCPACSDRRIRRTETYSGPHGPVSHYECLACSHGWREPAEKRPEFRPEDGHRKPPRSPEPS